MCHAQIYLKLLKFHAFCLNRGNQQQNVVVTLWEKKTPADQNPYRQIVEIAFGTSNCRDRRVLPFLSFFSNLWTSLISCGFFWYLWPSISTSIGIYWNTSLLFWRPFLAEAEKFPSKEKKESHKGAAKVALMCFLDSFRFFICSCRRRYIKLNFLWLIVNNSLILFGILS